MKGETCMPIIESREIHLIERPRGTPEAGNFQTFHARVSEPRDGEVQVRNRWLSVDPYMRGRMFDRASYTPPFQLGEPMEGGAIGTVEDSRDPRFSKGDWVLSDFGWREAYVAQGAELTLVDAELAPPQAYLGILGMPGFTAWIGLLEIGKLREGDHVFVSGAAGAVGSTACQIARVKGASVVGSAGSDEKVDWLVNELGVDTAFNYKTVGNLNRVLPGLAGQGFDLYFDNVGGEHLEAALFNMADFGRVVLCGMIDQYNAAIPPKGPRSLIATIPKRLTLRGFIVSDHDQEYGAFAQEMASWIREGRIVWKETVVEGIDGAVEAFLGLFTGANIGKMLVKV
jgi:NADPH-dependent curcumin reductase CurA